MDKIVDLLDILAKPERVTQIISDEMEATKLQFGDARRSEIIQHGEDISLEDLITPQDMGGHAVAFRLFPRRNRWKIIARSAAAAVAKQAAATKKTISSTTCLSPIRTITCCVSRHWAGCTG